MSQCSKCDKPILAKGLCNKHYAEHWRKMHPERSNEIARNSYHKRNPQSLTQDELASLRPQSCVICGNNKIVAKSLCRNCYHKSFQREKDITRKSANRKANPEKAKLEARAYRLAHPSKTRAANAQWYAKHPEYVRIKDAKRRARKAGSIGTYTQNDISNLMMLQQGKCAVCHCDITNKHHRDHIIPLALGGANDIKNIQLLCQPCNQSKHHRHPIEFMQSRGYLL